MILFLIKQSTKALLRLPVGAGWLSICFSQTTEDRFSCVKAHMNTETSNIIETLNLRISAAYTEAHTDIAGETFPKIIILLNLEILSFIKVKSFDIWAL